MTPATTTSAAPSAPDTKAWLRRQGLATAYPRVEPGVREIHEKVEGDGQGGEEEDEALDQRPVAVEDGEQNEAAKAGQREDLLDDDGPAEERPHLQADNGHGGDQRVGQRVAVDHLRLGQPLGSRGAHVVLVEHLEDGRS